MRRALVPSAMFWLRAAWKKGERRRADSWAAKRRCSLPTTRVIIAEVGLLFGSMLGTGLMMTCSR